jgi:transposase
MRITERIDGDRQRLEDLIHQEPRAQRRDRYRIVLLALQGREKQEIAELLSLGKSTVETWAYRYRDGGLQALEPKPRPGRAPKLSARDHAAFKDRFTQGPRPQDGVCTLRGKQAVRILNDEFGADYSLSGAYGLLHRLGLSCLAPRPRHEKNDPQAMERFRQSAPLLCKA